MLTMHAMGWEQRFHVTTQPLQPQSYGEGDAVQPQLNGRINHLSYASRQAKIISHEKMAKSCHEIQNPKE